MEMKRRERKEKEGKELFVKWCEFRKERLSDEEFGQPRRLKKITRERKGKGD